MPIWCYAGAITVRETVAQNFQARNEKKTTYLRSHTVEKESSEMCEQI